MWLSDGRRFLFRKSGMLLLMDSVLKRLRKVLSAVPHSIGSLTLAPNDRTIYLSVVRTEADIWLFDLE